MVQSHLEAVEALHGGDKPFLDAISEVSALGLLACSLLTTAAQQNTARTASTDALSDPPAYPDFAHMHMACSALFPRHVGTPWDDTGAR